MASNGSAKKHWIATGAAALVAALSISACGDDSPGGGGDAGAGGSGGASGGAGAGGDVGGPQKLVILHTNDLHSHLMGHAPEADYTPATTGDDDTRGGMARIATAVAAARAEAAADGTPVLLLDAGDFMMGTLFELTATSVPAELTLLHTLGYDATTLGNHELDWTPSGLAAILQAAVAEDVLVPIVASNLVFAADDPGDDELEALAEAGAIQSKLVKNVGSLRVGLFGLLGANAVQVTPQVAPLTFQRINTAARRMVQELREVDQVDVVIALSHSGIDSDGTGEDADLAEAVPGIDVIVSGHTHQTLSQPARVGETLIVTAGSYGSYLGKLELSVTPAATPGGIASVSVDGYELADVDDSIPGDAATQETIDTFIDAVDALLEPSGLAYRQVIATTEDDLPLPEFTEAPVGNLVADAYRLISAALEPEAPTLIAVEANGSLRAPLLAGQSGEVWFEDLFRIEPLGIGSDQEPGYALVSFYLNASDIRSGLELGAAGPVLSNDYFLQISGLEVEFDSSLPVFARVAAMRLVTPAGTETLDPEDTGTCYKVVTTSYVAGLLSVVKGLTAGLLAVEAKDSDCATLVDPTTRTIDRDPDADGVQELKNWQALVRYVASLPDADDDGVPNLPASYAMPQGRITQR